MNKYLRAMTSGLLATGPMTIAMLAMFKRLPFWQQTSLPPAQITSETLSKANLHPPAESKPLLTLLAHFAFGTFAAVPYAMVKKTTHQNLLLRGSVYGLGVWAASYMGWLPMFNYKTNATEMPRQRNTMMILAHIVWGVSLVYADKTLKEHKILSSQRR